MYAYMPVCPSNFYFLCFGLPVVIDSCKVRVGHRVSRTESAVLLLDVPSVYVADLTPMPAAGAEAAAAAASANASSNKSIVKQLRLPQVYAQLHMMLLLVYERICLVIYFYL